MSLLGAKRTLSSRRVAAPVGSNSTIRYPGTSFRHFTPISALPAKDFRIGQDRLASRCRQGCDTVCCGARVSVTPSGHERLSYASDNTGLTSVRYSAGLRRGGKAVAPLENLQSLFHLRPRGVPRCGVQLCSRDEVIEAAPSSSRFRVQTPHGLFRRPSLFHILAPIVRRLIACYIPSSAWSLIMPMRFTLTFGAIALYASAIFVGDAAAQTCTPPRPGLIGWWDADAATGTEVLDLKGQNRGSMIGGVRVVSGPRAPGPRKFERAFHFDGTGFIGMKNPPALQFGRGPFSLEAWFASERGEAEYPHIISKSNYPQSAPGAGYWIRLTPDGKTVEFFVGETLGAADFPRVRISAPAGPGVWHHVVGSRDAEGVAKLYVDGDVAGSERIDRTFSVGADTPFTVGAWNERFGIRNYAFSGYITDISAYDVALGANEVRALFTAPKCRGLGG